MNGALAKAAAEGLAIFAAAILVAIAFGLAIAARRRRRDPVRLFPWADKQALIRRAGGRCEHKSPLSRRCPNPGTQADHVVPWSKGGRTVLDNGQLLCRQHNLKKSARMPGPFYRWRLQRRRRRYPGPGR